MSAGVHPMSNNASNSCYTYQQDFNVPNAANQHLQQNYHHQQFQGSEKQGFHHQQQQHSGYLSHSSHFGGPFSRHAPGFPYHPHMQGHGSFYPSSECQIQEGYSQSYHHQRNSVMAFQQNSNFPCSQQPADNGNVGPQHQTPSPANFCSTETTMGSYMHHQQHPQQYFNTGQQRFPHHQQFQAIQQAGNGYYQQPAQQQQPNQQLPNAGNMVMGSNSSGASFPGNYCAYSGNNNFNSTPNPGASHQAAQQPQQQSQQYPQFPNQNFMNFNMSMSMNMNVNANMNHQMYQQPVGQHGASVQQQGEGFNQQGFFGQQCPPFHQQSQQFSGNQPVQGLYPGGNLQHNFQGKTENLDSDQPPTCMMKSRSSMQYHQFCEDRDDLGSEEGSQQSTSSSGGLLRPPADSGVSSCGDASAYFSSLNSSGELNNPPSVASDTFSTGSTSTPTPTPMVSFPSTSTSMSSSISCVTMTSADVGPLRTSSRCDSGKSESPESANGDNDNDDGDVDGGNDSGISDDVARTEPVVDGGAKPESVERASCALVGNPVPQIGERTELSCGRGDGGESSVKEEVKQELSSSPAPTVPTSLPSSTPSPSLMEPGGEFAITDVRSSADEGDKYPSVIVPSGWKREVHDSAVIYQSPSEVTLRSVEEVRTYLLSPGTCKCGLNCPVNIAEIFNFHPQVKVEPETTLSTSRLCNHRRKLGECPSFPSHSGFFNLLENPDDPFAIVEDQQPFGDFDPSSFPASSSSASILYPSPSPSPSLSVASAPELGSDRRRNSESDFIGSVDDSDVNRALSATGGILSRCRSSELQNKENILKSGVASKRRRTEWASSPTSSSSCDRSDKLVSNVCQPSPSSSSSHSQEQFHQQQQSLLQDTCVQEESTSAAILEQPQTNARPGSATKRRQVPPAASDHETVDSSPSNCAFASSISATSSPSAPKMAKMESSNELVERSRSQPPPLTSLSSSTSAGTARTPSPSFLADPNAFMAQQVEMVNRALMGNDLLSPPGTSRAYPSSSSSTSAAVASIPSSSSQNRTLCSTPSSGSSTTCLSTSTPSRRTVTTACVTSATPSAFYSTKTTTSSSTATFQSVELNSQFWSATNAAAEFSPPPLVLAPEEDDGQEEKKEETTSEPPRIEAMDVDDQGVDAATSVSTPSSLPSSVSSVLPSEADAPMATSSPNSDHGCNDEKDHLNETCPESSGDEDSSSSKEEGKKTIISKTSQRVNDGGMSLVVSDDTDDDEGDVVLGAGVGGEQEHDEDSVDIEEAVKILDADVAKSSAMASKEQREEGTSEEDNQNSTSDVTNKASSNKDDKDDTAVEAATDKTKEQLEKSQEEEKQEETTAETDTQDTVEEIPLLKMETKATQEKRPKSKPPTPTKEVMVATSDAMTLTSLGPLTALPPGTVSLATVGGTSMASVMTTDVLTTANQTGNMLASVITDASAQCQSLPPLTVPIVTQVTPTMHGFATAASPFSGGGHHQGTQVLQIVNTLAGPVLVPTSVADQFGAGQRILTQMPVSTYCSTAGMMTLTMTSGGLQQSSPGSTKTFVPICASPVETNQRGTSTTSPKRRSGGSNSSSGGKSRQSKNKKNNEEQQQMMQQHQQPLQLNHLQPTTQQLIAAATSPLHQFNQHQQLSQSAGGPFTLFTSQGATTATMIPSMLPFGTFAIIPAPATAHGTQGKMLSPNLVMQPMHMAQPGKNEPLPIQPGPAPQQSNQDQHTLQSTPPPQQATTLNFLQAFPMQPTFVATAPMMDFSRMIQANSAHGVLPTGPNQPVIQTLTNGGLGQKYVLQPGMRPILTTGGAGQHHNSGQTLGIQHLQQQPFLSAGMQFQPMPHDFFMATAAGTPGEVCMTVATSTGTIMAQQPQQQCQPQQTQRQKSSKGS